jgi:hypothetical protein
MTASNSIANNRMTIRTFQVAQAIQLNRKARKASLRSCHRRYRVPVINQHGAAENGTVERRRWF